MSKSILLVIPFFSGDKGQVERLGKWMGKLSGGKRIGEKLLFCGTPTVDMTGIGNNFVGLFDEIKGTKQILTPQLMPNENPWPKACNFQFINLAKFVEETRKDVDAFYYFEPDSLPLVPEWWDRICEDYEKQQRPFYGASAPNIEGKSVNGVHMIGTGIYPQDAYSRVKLFKKMEEEQPGRPWDVLMRTETNESTYFTDLIFNCNQARGYREEKFSDGEKFAFKTTASVVCPKHFDLEIKRCPLEDMSKAVVFHGIKDSSLRLHLQKKYGFEQEEALTFAHAGDVGDLIYAMRSIKEKGGGILRLSSHGYAREPMSKARIDSIKSLIEAQPYIYAIEPHDNTWVDFDFRPFRNIHKQHTNLLDDQADWIGEPRGLGDIEEPWLTVPAKRLYEVIVNRTPRYRGEKFPWPKLAAMKLDAAFIGLLEEHQEMNTIWPMAYVETGDFMEAASLIAGSKWFIGNQSACYAIAEALKHPRIQETGPKFKDCLFKSKTGIYCLDGKLDFSILSNGNPIKSVEIKLEDILNHPKLREMVEQIVSAKLDTLLK